MSKKITYKWIFNGWQSHMKGYPIFYHKRIMGIRNREGSLYMATGIDNSGLYEGKREAMGIIKTLASDITSFDIFVVIWSILFDYQRFVENSHENGQRIRKFQAV